ncbi:MAG: hypothetical protein D6805_10060 [Planctomycetota bacterium]|nr:MAG: hypothetical protein D6805_10060 [Planctomycetota bacterium]
MKKKTIWALGAVFASLFLFLGSQCKEKFEETTYQPVDPVFRVYVALGDSITQGVMSGDANYFTQTLGLYPELLAQQMQTFMYTPLMVLDDPSTNKFRRISPTLRGNNLGVSGMSVALLLPVLTTKVANVDPEDFKTEFDAVMAPLGKQTYDPSTGNFLDTTAVVAALSWKPTFVTIWLGNNDALGAVANTITDKDLDKLTALGGAIVYKNLGFPYSAQLDDNDPRGDTFKPINRMSTQANFQAAYQQLLGAFATSSTAPKMVVGNIPNVTDVAFMMSFEEVKTFFERYAGVSRTELDTAWGTTGFGGNAGATAPFDIVLVALGVFKDQKSKGKSNIEALLAVCGGRAVGDTTHPLLGGQPNVGLLDWDANHLDDGERTTLDNRIDTLNGVIDAVAASFGAVVVNVNQIFKNITANGADVVDAQGNVISTFQGLPIRKLSRIYPGAGDPTSTDGSKTNGGLFSLDGFHPGPTSHAIIANSFIDAINANKATLGIGVSLNKVSVFQAWLQDPFVDHDLDGYVAGMFFTKSSTQIGEQIILRDSDDTNPNVR